MRSQFMACLLLCGLTAAVAQAQVTQYGNVPMQGNLASSSCDCGGFWHGYGPECGAAAPYAVECGGCGASDGCGIGGYIGRNVYPVNPCVCGGSLCLDILQGIKHLLDRTLSCVIGTVFGGLQAVSCHATGSLAALRCAALAGCQSCGGSYCGGCGGGTIIDSGGYMSGVPTYMTPNGTIPIGPEPIEVPEDIDDPFTDEPVTAPAGPQSRRIRRPVRAGYRYVDPRARMRAATYQQPVRVKIEGQGAQRAKMSSVLKTSRTSNTARGRYFNGRPITMRR